MYEKKGVISVIQNNPPNHRLPSIKSGEFSYPKNWPAIKYLIPVYGAHGGNETLVGLEGQTTYQDPRRLKTVINGLGKIFSLEMAVLRKNCAELVKRTNNVPLGLNQNLVLIPVHIRTPITKDDGATGQVVANKIKHFKARPGTNGQPKSRIFFHDGSWLDVQQRVKSLFKLEGEAIIVKKAVAELHSYPSQPSPPDKLADPELGYQSLTLSTKDGLIPQLSLINEIMNIDYRNIDDINKLSAALLQQVAYLTVLVSALIRQQQTEDEVEKDQTG